MKLYYINRVLLAVVYGLAVSGIVALRLRGAAGSLTSL
jgi:hypothetical protein